MTDTPHNAMKPNRSATMIFHKGAATRMLWAYLGPDGLPAYVIDAENAAAARFIASGWNANGALVPGYRVVPCRVEWEAPE